MEKGVRINKVLVLCDRGGGGGARGVEGGVRGVCCIK